MEKIKPEILLIDNETYLTGHRRMFNYLRTADAVQDAFDLDMNDCMILQYVIDWINTGSMKPVFENSKTYFHLDFKNLKNDLGPSIRARNTKKIGNTLKRISTTTYKGEHIIIVDYLLREDGKWYATDKGHKKKFIWLNFELLNMLLADPYNTKQQNQPEYIEIKPESAKKYNIKIDQINTNVQKMVNNYELSPVRYTLKTVPKKEYLTDDLVNMSIDDVSEYYAKKLFGYAPQNMNSGRTKEKSESGSLSKMNNGGITESKKGTKRPDLKEMSLNESLLEQIKSDGSVVSLEASFIGSVSKDSSLESNKVPLDNIYKNDCKDNKVKTSPENINENHTNDNSSTEKCNNDFQKFLDITWENNDQVRQQEIDKLLEDDYEIKKGKKVSLTPKEKEIREFLTDKLTTFNIKARDLVTDDATFIKKTDMRSYFDRFSYRNIDRAATEFEKTYIKTKKKKKISDLAGLIAYLCTVELNKLPSSKSITKEDLRIHSNEKYIKQFVKTDHFDIASNFKNKLKYIDQLTMDEEEQKKSSVPVKIFKIPGTEVLVCDHCHYQVSRYDYIKNCDNCKSELDRKQVTEKYYDDINVSTVYRDDPNFKYFSGVDPILKCSSCNSIIKVTNQKCHNCNSLLDYSNYLQQIQDETKKLFEEESKVS